MNKKRYLVIVGIVVAAVLLSILFYTMFANHRPVITSLEAERDMIILSGSCQIVCNAADPDGDELSYGWSTSGGGITGEGAMVTWTAPDSVGSYTVTAMVTDDHGASVTKQVTITARDNKPPIINSVTADPDWIPTSGKVQVTCDATDPDGDGLSYAWLTDEGDISGTGAVVTWTAPEAHWSHYVMVMVIDGYGGSAMSWVGISSPVPSANTELHQAQTAIIAAMADGEAYILTTPSVGTTARWSGESGVITVVVGSVTYDAADYLLGTFRATYTVNGYGEILSGTCDGVGQWGAGIVWDPGLRSWKAA